MDSYRIVRHFTSGKKRTVQTGLTLQEAKAHCSDPETSSHTAQSAPARRRTKRLGAWFDAFYRERG
jgi:hypothetical protein